MEEVIDLNLGSSTKEVSSIQLNVEPEASSDSKPVNFGMGLEMLMNDKKVGKKEGGGKTSDLDALENDLNELTDELETSPPSAPQNGSKSSEVKKPMFTLNTDPIDSGIKKSETESKPVENVDFTSGGGDSILGRLTKSTTEKGTWDGFNKFNDVPVNPTMEAPKKEMSREEIMRKKFEILRKLEHLRDKKGIKLSKNYTMESSLDEMEGEFEMLKSERERHASMKFQGNMMLMCVQGLEFLNKQFDPFDVDLDGWHEQVNENLDDYDEIFAELHEKYKSKASMAPELKLLFQLGGSALMVHMSNKMMSNLLPTSDDVLRQNPALMQQFMQASADSMKSKAPGFSSFMSGLMGGGGPQPPQERNQMPSRPEMIPPGRSNVPERMGGPQFADAENLDQRQGAFEQEQPPRRSMAPPPRNPEPDIRRAPNTSSSRPEMKGPVDIGELLSGLKTKKVELSSKKRDGGGGSVVSIDELKSISRDADKPTKSKRKPRSERNTISLNL